METAIAEHVGAWLLCLIASVFWLCVSYLFVIIVYNLIFHPLARFSGPRWACISPLWISYHTYRRDLGLHVRRSHRIYGGFRMIALRPN